MNLDSAEDEQGETGKDAGNEKERIEVAVEIDLVKDKIREKGNEAEDNKSAEAAE